MPLTLRCSASYVRLMTTGQCRHGGRWRDAVTVTLETRSRCQLCGYLHRVVMSAAVVVSKCSMRTTGPMLGGFQYPSCPECGTPAGRASVAPRTAYVVVPEDAARVAEYRFRKFGVTDKGAPRERVAG